MKVVNPISRLYTLEVAAGYSFVSVVDARSGEILGHRFIIGDYQSNLYPTKLKAEASAWDHYERATG